MKLVMQVVLFLLSGFCSPARHHPSVRASLSSWAGPEQGAAG